MNTYNVSNCDPSAEFGQIGGDLNRSISGGLASTSGARLAGDTARRHLSVAGFSAS